MNANCTDVGRQCRRRGPPLVRETWLIGLVLLFIVVLAGTAFAQATSAPAEAPSPSAPAPAAGSSAPTADAPVIAPNAPASTPALRPVSPGPPREKLLPGLLLGLLLALAGLHLARQVYEDAPGSLATSGLLVAAFVQQYVAFKLHTPFVGTGPAARMIEAWAPLGVVLALVSFLAVYLELRTLPRAVGWTARSVATLAVLLAIWVPFNATIAAPLAQTLLFASFVLGLMLCLWLGRDGDDNAEFLAPGLAFAAAALALSVITAHIGGARAPLFLEIAQGAFVLAFLLIAFAVESAGAAPRRAYLALPSPAAPGAPGGAGEAAASPGPEALVPGGGRSSEVARPVPFSERRLALALAAAGHGLFDWSVGEGRVTLSAESEAMMGLSRGAFEGTYAAWLDLVLDEDRDGVREMLAHYVSQGETTFSLPFRVLAQDGSVLKLWLDGACLQVRPDAGAMRCIGLIAPRHDRPGETQPGASLHEPPRPRGRRALIEAVDRVLERTRAGEGNPSALLVLDLDRFQSINETYGHTMGDHVLDQVAQRLTSTLETGDVLMRLGGDEFALILAADAALGHVSERAERVLAAIQRPVTLPGAGEVFVGASLGFVSLAAMTVSGETALRDAEAALYHVKRAGGGRHAAFAADMRGGAGVRVATAADLSRALDREELEVHYQPVVALADGRIAGVSSVLCWRHPEEGPLTTEAFKPTAEDASLALALDRSVVSVTAMQLSQWQAFFPLTPPLFALVRLLNPELATSEFVRDVREALTVAAVAPQSLVLEVSQEALARDAEALRALLGDLTGLGARLMLVVNDASTAVSDALGTWPFRIIKLTRPAMANLVAPDGQARESVRALIANAHALGLDVVADGIEDEAVLLALRELSCDYGQGPRFGNALQAEDMHPFIAQNRRP